MRSGVYAAAMVTVWFGPVPAEDAGLPECGFEPDEFFPNGCTREAGHGGEHGNPDWDGRVTIKPSPGGGGIDLVTEDDYQYAPAMLRNRADVDRLVDALKAAAEEAWPS